MQERLISQFRLSTERAGIDFLICILGLSNLFDSYFFGLKKVTKKACRMYASTRSASWQAHHGKETPDALMWIAKLRF